MLQVAALGVEPGQVQHHFFRFGLDRLRGLELRFGFVGLVLHRVKLPQHHVIFHALRLQGHNLLELGNGLVQHLVCDCPATAGAAAPALVFALAQLAQVDPAQQLVRVDVVGRVLQQHPRRHFGIVHAAHAEIEIGQIVGQLRRIGIGIERQLVLLDGLVHLVGAAVGDGVILIHGGQRQVIVRLGAIGLGGRRRPLAELRPVSSPGLGRGRLRGRGLCRREAGWTCCGFRRARGSCVARLGVLRANRCCR